MYSFTYVLVGKSLVSVTIVGGVSLCIDELKDNVKMQLKEWFGEDAGDWTFLKSYQIPYAQPGQSERPYVIKGKAEEYGEGIYVVGDHRGGATLNGAVKSGKRAAEHILNDKKKLVL